MNELVQVSAGAIETVGALVAAILTLAVLSYCFGDNVLFRFAEHLFVGIVAGYGAALAWNLALWPRILLLLNDPSAHWYYGIFFVLGFLLLSRGIAPLSSLGDLPLAVLFGVGAAFAIGGAIAGSLAPQIGASIVSFAPHDYGGGLVGWAYAIDAALLVVGTLATLASFHYATDQSGPLGLIGAWFARALGVVGQRFIMIVFGALFGGALLSFFSVLYGRISFLLHDVLGLQVFGW